MVGEPDRFEYYSVISRISSAAEISSFEAEIHRSVWSSCHCSDGSWHVSSRFL